MNNNDRMVQQQPNIFPDHSPARNSIQGNLGQSVTSFPMLFVSLALPLWPSFPQFVFEQPCDPACGCTKV